MKAIRLTKKLIDSVVGDVAGGDVLPLVHTLKGRENVSEFVLAEEIEREINVTRNMLYRLHNANLVSFTRKKDKKKGWYIYYWTFNPPMIKSLYVQLKKQKLERLNERLDREQSNHFFKCPEGCMRLDFELSTEYGFKCPECGELLAQDDNQKTIKDVKKQIKELEAELKKLK